MPAFAPGALISGPFQVELQGVLMDAVSCDAPLIITKFLKGLGTPATMRNNNKLRPQRDGEFASPQYLGSRPLSWSVAARGTTAAAVVTALQNLGAAFSPIPDTDTDRVVPLIFTLADASQKWVVYGKPDRAATVIDYFLRTYQSLEPFTEDIEVAFIGADPLIYDFTLQAGSTGLGAASGGLSFPFSFPFAFGSALPGQVVCTNRGNRRTYPQIIVAAGPSGLSGIGLANQLTGETWTTSAVLAAGDVLTIDMADRTVLLNQTTSRASTVNRPPSTWFGIDPLTAGPTSISFIGFGAGSTMTVAYRSAYNF